MKLRAALAVVLLALPLFGLALYQSTRAETCGCGESCPVGCPCGCNH